MTSRPSPLIFGRQQSLGQSGSCLASCRACLRGLRLLLVLGGASGVAAGSPRCPSQSHRLCFPGPAWIRQPGTAGCACSSAGEPCGEPSPGVAVGQVMRLGSWEDSFSRGLGIPSCPPFHKAVSDHGLSPFFRVLHQRGERLLIISSPQPAATSEHGHTGRVELPHLPQHSK